MARLEASDGTFLFGQSGFPGAGRFLALVLVVNASLAAFLLTLKTLKMVRMLLGQAVERVYGLLGDGEAGLKAGLG